MLLSNLFSAAEGGFNWYGFLIGTGMVVCIIIAYFMAKKRGYYKDIVFDIAIICIPLAIVGARLYYVIFDIIGNGASWTFLDIIGFGSRGLSGLAIYGGLIGACLGGLIVAIWKKHRPGEQRVTFLQMADLAFVVIILGQVIGRWGNFANQEAFGNPVTNPSLQWFPFAVYIDRLSGWYQATFFYESSLNLIGFVLLFWLYNGKKKSFDGFILSVYCIFYGTVRFFIEGLRSDSLYLIPDVIRVSQALSALLVFFGIGFIIAHCYRARNQNKKPFIFVDESLLNGDYLGYEASVLSHPIRYEKKKKKWFFFNAEEPESENESTDGEISGLEADKDGFEENKEYLDNALTDNSNEGTQNKDKAKEKPKKKINEDFDEDLFTGYNGEDVDEDDETV